MSVSDIRTPRLKLVAQTVEQALAMIDSLDDEQRSQVSPEWLAKLNSPDVDHWTLGFTVVERATETAVGLGGFKGPPSSDQMVEIAYAIEPEYQNQGLATEVAHALTGFSFDSGEVHTVRAHTISSSNASARVLRKCGFALIGEIMDPEDGLVYRWERSHR